MGGVKLGDFSFVGNKTITQLAFRFDKDSRIAGTTESLVARKLPAGQRGEGYCSRQKIQGQEKKLNWETTSSIY